MGQSGRGVAGRRPRGALWLLGWTLSAAACGGPWAGLARGAENTGERRPFAAQFEFALIGDVPYDDIQITNYFPNLIEELNRAPLAFVVHDGDIKAGHTPCTDAVFERVFIQFQTIQHPLVYIFGDNEWRDCGKVQTNAFEPLERLEKLRAMFAAGHESLGQKKLVLARQSDSREYAAYRENVRWLMGGVLFAGLNVPGDDNYFDSPEYAKRNAANLAWLKESFALAKEQALSAVLVVIQANPHFDLAATNRLRRGFNEFIQALEMEAITFRKPVVLVHGDSHYFRIDQPLMGSRSRRRVENFTRVETFGNPDVHWIEVLVDVRDPNVFRFVPQYVRRNLQQH
jgi:hypothetical protein